MLTASNPSEFPELPEVAGGDEVFAVTPEDCDCCEDSAEATLCDWFETAASETDELAASVLLL